MKPENFEQAELAPFSDLGAWLDSLPMGTVIKPVYKDGHLSLEILPDKGENTR